MAHRLLLADDSITIQKVIELTFADEGIEVVAVSDGDQAIARLDAERFDIVLADAGMPGKDGFDVAAHLLARDGNRRPPVLLLTGAFEPVDDDRVALVGARAVLAKPFEPQVLVAKVRELLASPLPPDELDEEPPAADSLMAAPPPPGTRQSTDDYFARLDRAFASLNVPLEPKEPGPRTAKPPQPPEAIAAPPPPPADPVRPEPFDSAQGRPVEGRAAPRAPGGTLADTFSTLLAVEQGELPASALEPPSTAAEDELVDRIARRVVEQLGDNAVRELATDIVSRTAERLVKEEIERIKAGIAGS